MALTPEQISTNLSANYMAVKPTLVGANAVDPKRQQQIFANLQKGYNANSTQFTDRQTFENAYGYAGKPAGEKVLLDTFYRTVNPVEPTVRAAVPNVAKPKGNPGGFVINSEVKTVPISQVPKQDARLTTGAGSMTYQLKPATANSQVLKEVPVAPLSAPTPNVKKQPVTSLAPATPNKPSAKTSEEIIKDNTDWAKGTGKYAPTASSTSTPSTPQPTDFTYVPKTDTKKTDTKVTAYKPTDKGILNASEDSLNAAKFDQLLSSKNKDIVNAQNEYAKGLKVLQGTNANIRALYGIDEKGNIDPNNTTSLAFTQKAALEDYKKVKQDLLDGYTGTRLNNVRAQVFQTLAQRNVTDVSKISPEMLIQLSGEVGAQAMNDIYQAKEKTVNDIEARKREVQGKLDSLRENGMIKNNEFLVASETLRASSERLKQSINKQFANDVFGLVDLKNAKSEAKNTDVLNTIQKFGAQLGITGKGLVALNDYVGRYKNSADALTGMLADLGNPNSNIYKAIENAEQRAAISAALAQQQKLELASAQKKGSATGTSMTWGLPARTYVSTSFINKVKDGLGPLVKDSATKAFANEIADAYYKSQGTEASKGLDGFMDDTLVEAVPAQFARDFVSTYLSPDKLTNDKMTYGLGMFPEVMKAVSGDTLTQ